METGGEERSEHRNPAEEDRVFRAGFRNGDDT